MEIPELGTNCAFAGCGQLDFLPFTCKGCGETFCLEHRSCHGCQAGASSDATCIVCPICACSVKYVEGEDINVTYERHMQTTCDPTKYAKIAKKPRCPVPGCKEKLTSVNSFKCKDCRVEVCLKHRFPKDHQCGSLNEGRHQAPADVMRRLSVQAAQTRATSAPPPPQAAPPRAQLGAPPPRAQLGMGAPQPSRAAVSRPQPLQTVTPQSTEPRLTSAAVTRPVPAQGVSAAGLVGIAATTRPVPTPSTSAAGLARDGPELCQQCGTRFPDVMALIAHAESAHSGGQRAQVSAPAPAPAQSRVPENTGAELCQQCGARFPNVMALIAHAESAHSGGQQAPAPSQTPGPQQQRQGVTSAIDGTRAISSGREVCPQCRMRFHDVTALVAHVQSKHERSSRNSQCRVC